MPISDHVVIAIADELMTTADKFLLWESSTTNLLLPSSYSSCILPCADVVATSRCESRPLFSSRALSTQESIVRRGVGYGPLACIDEPAPRKVAICHPSSPCLVGLRRTPFLAPGHRPSPDSAPHILSVDNHRKAASWFDTSPAICRAHRQGFLSPGFSCHKTDHHILVRYLRRLESWRDRGLLPGFCQVCLNISRFM